MELDPSTPPPIIHKCGARAGGRNFAHCSGCCRTFSSVTTFDKHRKDSACLNPGELGMVEKTRAGWTRWVLPFENDPLGLEDTP